MPQGRHSRFIRRKPASNIYHAVRIAEHAGIELSHFVTINFSTFGHAPEDVSTDFRWIRARWADWMRRPSRKTSQEPVSPADVWVVEAASGVMAVHWVMHLPVNRVDSFMKRLQVWVEKVAKQEVPPNAIDIRKVSRSRGISRYILKGIDPAYASTYGVRAEDQGTVVGRRSGYSRKLGPTVKSRMREEGTYPPVSRWARHAAQGATAQARAK